MLKLLRGHKNCLLDFNTRTLPPTCTYLLILFLDTIPITRSVYTYTPLLYVRSKIVFCLSVLYTGFQVLLLILQIFP